MRYTFRSLVTTVVLGTFLSIGFATVPAARSQSAAAEGRPTEAQVQRLGRLFQLDKLLGASNAPVRRNLVEALATDAPKATEAELTAAGTAIESELLRGNRVLARAVLDLYRSRLTRAEMATLIDFYSSPTGAAVMTKIGLIMNDANNVILKLNEKVMENALDAGVAVLRAKGHKL